MYPNRLEDFEIDFEKGTIFNKRTQKSLGTTDQTGHVRFNMDRKRVSIQRVLWEQFHKVELRSDQWITHINKDKTDNRISNLQPTTRSHVLQNQTDQKNITSGFRGVTKLNVKGLKRDSFKGQLNHEGKRMYLGCFRTAEDAARAYNEKATELNETLGCKFPLNEI